MSSKVGGARQAVAIAKGVVWLRCNLDDAGSPLRSEVEASTSAVLESMSSFGAEVPRATVQDSLCAVAEGLYNSSDVSIFVPEAMPSLDYCEWNGDDHYDMSVYVTSGPPPLGQIASFVRMVDDAVNSSKLVIHVSSISGGRRANQAVLAGSVLVLRQGMSAESAWHTLLRATPPPVSDPAKAWDRFPSPFSRNGNTCASSLTVVDCLEGLEAAVENGWFENYRTFDIEGWRMLRKKFDASWLIPGDMLAFGNPSETARNPRYPGLLDDDSEEMCCSPAYHAKDDLGANCKDEGSSHSGGSQERVRCSSNSTATPTTVCTGTDFAIHTPPPSEPGIHTPRLDPISVTEGGEHGLRPRPIDTAVVERLDSSWRVSPLPSDSFVSYFRNNEVGLVVQLHFDFESKKREHVNAFGKGRIKTVALEFEDGNIPPKNIERNFYQLCQEYRQERKNGSQGIGMAVHCMGGMGRTGVIVGGYAVRTYGVSGRAFHGWCRICRPGSVQTPIQERWLRALQPKAACDKSVRTDTQSRSCASRWQLFRVNR